MTEQTPAVRALMDALAGSPEVRPGEATALVAAVVGETRTAERSAVLMEAQAALTARHCSPESVDVVAALLTHRLCPVCDGWGSTATATEDGGVIRRCRSCDRRGLVPLAAAGQAPAPQPHDQPMTRFGPQVQGRCPACGLASLFVGSGGYVTCGNLPCPEPDAASTLLERRTAPQPETAPDPLAYGPRGYRCGCGKDAHSNLTPCAPDAEPGTPDLQRYRRALAEADGYDVDQLEPHDYLDGARAVLAVVDAEHATLRARIGAIHREVDGSPHAEGSCIEDGQDYPCATLRALHAGQPDAEQGGDR